MIEPHYSPSLDHIATLAKMPCDPMSRVKAINDYIQDCEMRSRLVRRTLTIKTCKPVSRFDMQAIATGIVLGLCIVAAVWGAL